MSQLLKLIASSYFGSQKDHYYECLFNQSLAKLSIDLRIKYNCSSTCLNWLARLRDLRHWLAKQIIAFFMRSFDEMLQILREEFSQFKIKPNDSEFIGKERLLLKLISKARAHLLNFRHDNSSYNRFKTDLFQLSFERLPNYLLKKYLEVDPKFSNKSLSGIMRILSKQIFEQDIISDRLVFGDSMEFCYYCKCIGHPMNQCVILNSITCYRCFQTGHLYKDCQYKEVPSVLILFSPEDSHNQQQLVGSEFCLECAQFGHKANKCSLAVCFRCYQSGHMSRQCSHIQHD